MMPIDHQQAAADDADEEPAAVADRLARPPPWHGAAGDGAGRPAAAASLLGPAPPLRVGLVPDDAGAERDHRDQRDQGGVDRRSRRPGRCRMMHAERPARPDRAPAARWPGVDGAAPPRRSRARPAAPPRTRRRAARPRPLATSSTMNTIRTSHRRHAAGARPARPRRRRRSCCRGRGRAAGRRSAPAVGPAGTCRGDWVAVAGSVICPESARSWHGHTDRHTRASRTDQGISPDPVAGQSQGRLRVST